MRDLFLSTARVKSPFFSPIIAALSLQALSSVLLNINGYLSLRRLSVLPLFLESYSLFSLDIQKRLMYFLIQLVNMIQVNNALSQTTTTTTTTTTTHTNTGSTTNNTTTTHFNHPFPSASAPPLSPIIPFQELCALSTILLDPELTITEKIIPLDTIYTMLTPKAIITAAAPATTAGDKSTTGGSATDIGSTSAHRSPSPSHRHISSSLMTYHLLLD